MVRSSVTLMYHWSGDMMLFKGIRKSIVLKPGDLFRILLLLGCVSVMGIFPNANLSFAQSSGNIDWSDEEIVAQVIDAAPQSLFPVITADNYGTAHIFWTVGQGIYYSYKKGQEWSQPIDVVWEDQKEFTFPAVIIDHNEVLHLFWVSWGKIYHKCVPSQDAADIKAWSEQQVVVEFGGTGTSIRVALDTQNRIHLVFSDWHGVYGQTIQGNVYQIVSDNNGTAWTEPVKVSYVPREDLATDPRIAIDDQDKVHIVWGLMDPLLHGESQGVYYSRLSQDGQLEIIQEQIDYPETEETWMTNINVATLGNNQVVLVWVCGLDQARRCTRSSKNGGDHWNDTQEVFTDLLGLSGWDALGIDGSNNLYWLTVLRYPQALYSSVWSGIEWQDPPQVASTDTVMKLGENINAATNLGNQIHVVVQLGNNIAYMRGITDALGKPVHIPPTSSPEVNITYVSPSPVPPSAAVITSMQTPVPANINNVGKGINTTSQWLTIFISAVPVILIIIVFGMIRLSIKK